MGADIYLQSVYDEQREAYKVDELRERLDRFRAIKQPSDDTKVVFERDRELYIAALRAAERGAYFRDSYNSSCLAWLCNLSYWNENGNTDENGGLRIERAKEWLAVLQSTHIPQVVLHVKLNWEENRRRELIASDNDYKALDYAYLAKPELQVDDDIEGHDFRSIVTYFEDKRQSFMTLLERSIDLDEPLVWSV